MAIDRVKDNSVKKALNEIYENFFRTLNSFNVINPNNIERAVQQVFGSASGRFLDNSNEEAEKSSSQDQYEPLYKFVSDRKLSQHDCDLIVELLNNYFDNRNPPDIRPKMKLQGGTKKPIASALGQIYREIKKGKFEKSFVLLLKNNIKDFENDCPDEGDFHDSTLYKYITSSYPHKTSGYIQPMLNKLQKSKGY